PGTPPRNPLGPAPAAPRTDPVHSAPPPAAARRARAASGSPGGAPAQAGGLPQGWPRRPTPRRRPPATPPAPPPAAPALRSCPTYSSAPSARLSAAPEPARGHLAGRLARGLTLQAPNQGVLHAGSSPSVKPTATPVNRAPAAAARRGRPGRGENGGGA